MNRFVSIVLFLSMAAVSCERNEDLSLNGQSMRFSATFSDNDQSPAARAVPGVEGDAVDVLWEAGDLVGVYAADGAPSQFTAQTAGQTTTLEGPALQSEVFYAMYPYDLNATISDKTISTSVPATQSAERNKFASYLAVSLTTSEDMDFVFKNVCALMQVYVGYEGLTKIVFSGNQGEIVAGDIKVDASRASYVYDADGSATVTLLPEDGATFGVGMYFFSVLPQTFPRGFTVTAYKEDSEVFDKRIVNEQITLGRSQFVQASAFLQDGQIVPGENGIRIPEQLISFAKVANQGGDISSYCNASGDVVLLDDIQLPDMEWTPIGNATIPVYNELVDTPYAFTGVFDGQGHTISGLRLSPSGTSVTTSGFFGATNNSVIRNVNFEDVQMDVNCLTRESGGHLAIGSLVGYAKDTEVENVSVNARMTGTVISTDNLNVSIAGVVGIMAATGSDKSHITGCTFGGSVTTDIGTKYTNNNSASVAGILGSIYYNSTSVVKITDCVNNAAIDVKSHRAAGIAAAAAYTQIENCVNNGDITANYSENWTPGSFADGTPVVGVRIGGIIGYNQVSVSNSSYIKNCINRGTVSTSQAASAVGGVAGLIRTTTLEGCKNSGDVYASDVAVDYTITEEGQQKSGTLQPGRGLLAGQVNKGAAVTFTKCYICGRIGTESSTAVDATQGNYLDDNIGAHISADATGSKANWTSSNVYFWSNPE